MSNRILIGPVNRTDIGSIPMLNRAFMDGLSDHYTFIPFNVGRKYGKSKVASFNAVNIWYLVKQYLLLIYKILNLRPAIFHYAITSNWNFVKSLFFLKTAKKLGTKKVVGHLHGGSFDIFLQNLSNKKKIRAIRLLNSIDVIIVASVYWKDFLLDNDINTLIMVVNNPIDNSYVRRINQQKPIIRNNRFLFVGSIGKRKGFYDIIDVSTKLNDKFILDAIGAGDKKNDLNKINSLIKKYGLISKINIVQSEKMTLEEKVHYFSNEGVFLFPSHNENFPLVILEAACAGIPIISTRVGAIPEFFTHMENIYFVEPGDLNQIEEAIKFMIKNPNEKIKLGNAAKKLYNDKLSQEIVMSQMLKVYQKLI